jgi:uncharacterized membrane protein YdbT with pleckstrin-like domain
MPKKQSDDLTREDDEKQQTDKGLTIPVPERDEFYKNLDKLTPPAEQPERSEPTPRRTRRAR